MFSAKQIAYIQKINLLLPVIVHKAPDALLCMYCNYVNENNFSFCTNCGYPLQNKLLVDAFNKRIEQRSYLLIKAENAILVARIVLYVMAAFLSLGVFFLFAEGGHRKYIVVLMAVLLAAIFFSLAFWSRKNPFTALLSAFIILIAFSAINIFGSLARSFTTLTGLTGMLLCIALLFVILKGIQGAYTINLIKEELQMKL